MINIKGDVKSFARQMDRIQRKVLPAAIPSAINKTIAQINTQARREIGRTLGIPQKHFKRRMKVYRATRRKQEGKNWIGTRVMIPVSSVFTGARGIAYAKQLRTVPANMLFRAKMPSGHDGVFHRKPEAARKAGRDSKGRVKKNRLPIQEIAIDLSQIASPVLSKWARKITGEKFKSILANEIRFRLRKQ